MKKNLNNSRKNKKNKLFKFYEKKSPYTILDKIYSMDSMEGIITCLAYLLLGFSVTLLMLLSSAGYTIFISIFKNFQSYSIGIIVMLIITGLIIYIIMIGIGIIAIICYDRNAAKYEENGVKIAKFVIIIFLVTAFKDSDIIQTLKELL